MTTRTFIWTLTWETMEGVRRVSKFRAGKATDAVDMLCREYRVGNLFSVCDSNGVQHI